MEELTHEEKELAECLKSCCDEEGKEKDVNTSAKVLYQLGLLYKGRTSDKISLIQSAALLNAAIVRQPSNVQYQEELQDLCNHVLLEAKAEKRETNLVVVSKVIWLKVKQMRNHAKARLEEMQTIPCGLPECKLKEMENEKISSIQTLQNEITEKYIDVMSHVSQRCCGIMGKPPCEYAVTGLGSLARKEITPYSDFEHVIVLEEGVQHTAKYETILEYFRWFSVMFQIVIINLKETIIRSVAVPSLNDDSVPGGDWFFDAFTPCGIKFDGMQLIACKFPLGRKRKTTNKPFTVELIRPVSEMIKYLEKEEDPKNGHHLADILTKSCFVSGDRVVFENFKKEVQKEISDEHLSSNAQYLQKLKENFKMFDPNMLSSILCKLVSCNIKRVVYQSTTTFLSALKLLHSIPENSCFTIIHNLRKRLLISKDAAHKLLYAVAVACEIRLKVYMAKKGQDNFVRRDFNGNDYEVVRQFSDAVGEQSLADLFSVAYALQIVVEKENYFDFIKFVNKPVHRFEILLFFEFHELFFLEWHQYSKLEKKSEENYEHKRIEQAAAFMFLRHGEVEKAMQMMDYVNTNMKIDPTVKVSALKGKAECLLSLCRYDEAIEYIESVQDSVIKLDIHIDYRKWCCVVLSFIRADCMKHLKRHDEAIASYRQAYTHIKSVSISREEKKMKMFDICRNIGLCLVKLKKYSEAISTLKEGLKYICRDRSLDTSMSCVTYGSLGYSYLQLGKFDKALKYYQKEYNLRVEAVPIKDRVDDEELKQCRTVMNLLETNQQLAGLLQPKIT